MLCLADENIGVVKNFQNIIKLKILAKIFGARTITKKEYAEAKKIQSVMSIKGSWRGLANIKDMHVSIHPIGFKDDEFRKDNSFGYEQEIL
jgi:hypothetical protein